MSYFVSIIIFILIFSILILIHEFGHFYAARKAGVRVDEFGIGLPPRAKGLWKDKKGTLYSLNWIPFGGFVRMFGEDSVDAEMRHAEGSFASKSIAWRTIIILGGVIMNFLLGYVLLVWIFSVGTKPFVVTPEDFQHYRDIGVIVAEDRVIVSGFAEDSPAMEAGLLENDQILSINGQEISKNQDVISITQENVNTSVSMLVMREEESFTYNVLVNAEGRMGVIISESPLILEFQEVKYGFSEALYQAGYETARLSVLTMKMFVEVIFDLLTKFELSDQVSGPVGIAQLTHQTTQNGSFMDLIKLIALLSISLGAINVIPIPALDGGRFLSIVFEMVTKRRPNAAWEARIHAFGFVLLILLILVITYNDIVRLITG